MRALNLIVLHHSGTTPSLWVNKAEITKWHVARKMRTIAYHYLILSNGTIQRGRGLNEIGAHCKGFNTRSIGICLVGGKPNQNGNIHNAIQFESLEKVLKEIKKETGLELPIKYHRELDPKYKPHCPSLSLNFKKYGQISKITYSMNQTAY